MSAPHIAYRIACAPVEDVGGPTAQHVALVAATRWAQEDGRFILRQVALQAATGLSERPISAAVKALRSAKVFVPLGADEWLIAVEHLRRIGGSSLRIGGPSRSDLIGADAAGTAEKEVGAASGAHGPPGSRSRADAGRASESDAGPTEKEVGAAAGRNAVSPLTDVSASSSSEDALQEEAEDARASDAAGSAATSALTARHATGEPSAWTPTDGEAKTLAWVEGHGLPLRLPDGRDLRGEWLATLRHLKPSEAELVRRRMAGDTPTAFRNALGPELKAKREERAAAAATSQTRSEQAERARAEQAAADAERAAAEQRLADDRARETGAYVEQARALLEDIGRADPRSLVLADSGWCAALVRLRSDVNAGRVIGINLVRVRTGWPEVRDRALPPAPPVAPEPAHDPAVRRAGDAADHEAARDEFATRLPSAEQVAEAGEP